MGLASACAAVFFIPGGTVADPGFKDDAGMKEWRGGFMAKYLPGGDINDITYVYAYSCCMTLMQVLKQCSDDFSR